MKALDIELTQCVPSKSYSTTLIRPGSVSSLAIIFPEVTRFGLT